MPSYLKVDDVDYMKKCQDNSQFWTNPRLFGTLFHDMEHKDVGIPIQRGFTKYQQLVKYQNGNLDGRLRFPITN